MVGFSGRTPTNKKHIRSGTKNSIMNLLVNQQIFICDKINDSDWSTGPLQEIRLYNFYVLKLKQVLLRLLRRTSPVSPRAPSEAGWPLLGREHLHGSQGVT
uniref:Uncharacterized protein n=1 Tax=Lepeophtheirus salmonis TaxID=72036 RepID=A0A0K2UXZ7_LEPSM